MSRVQASVFLASPQPQLRRGSRPSVMTATMNTGSVPVTTTSNALKCPELLLRGIDLQLRVALERLEKKGKRFESPWNEFYVTIYAGVLFYYDDLDELPRGIVPLVGSTVKAVDRIFKNSDSGDGEATAENCGPCFKVTSSAHRVLLFRCDSDATRNRWIREIQVHGSGSGSAMTFDSTSSSYASNEDSSNGGHSTRSRSLSPSRTFPNRFSLDESNFRRMTNRRNSPKNTNSDVATDTDISEMLRDAMAMVKKQKLEILELRRALEEARHRDRTSSVATRPSDVDDVVISSHVSSSKSIPEVDEPVADTEPVAPPVATTTPPPSSMNDPVAMLAVDAGMTDYLQKQAMELAEIARYLQLTFQNDVLAATKQINSTHSSTPTEPLDHGSITSSNYSDQPSEMEEVDSDGERLSEFEEADTRFLESSGMLDSIQKVMEDFSSQSDPPRSNAEQIIIDDDVIAEIKQGVSSDTKRDALHLMDSNTLRSLRSRSACDEPTDYTLSLSPQSIARTQSAREFSVDDFASPPLTSRHRKRLPKDLSVLVIDDNMAVVSSILQTASREEKTSLLLPLLRVFHRHNRLSRLIRWAIESEVASVMNVATLFRSDDYASRLVSTYSKSVGSHFIKVILVAPIQEIYKLKFSDVDLTPNNHEEEPDPILIQKNAKNLMDACQRVLDSILVNRSSIPLSYYHICSHLNTKVINRFDGSMEGLAIEDPASLTRSVIGGFLFLRFVCPAIATPHLHGLVDNQPEPETRKILVLVTKLLFKTATSVLFNDKEPHLRVLNPFIEKNSPAIQQLFYELAIAPSGSIDESFASDSHGIFSNMPPEQPELDIAVIRTIAAKNIDEIEKKLSVSGCSPTTVVNLRLSLEASRGDESTSKGHRPKKLNMKFLSSFSKIVRKQSEA